MSNPQIELSVRVTDGSFEARLNMPVTATSDEINKFASSWLAALEQALNIVKGAGQPERES